MKIQATLTLALLAIGCAPEGTDLSAPVAAEKPVYVDDDGHEWVYLGPAARTHRRDPEVRLTDEQIAAIEDRVTERAAVQQGRLSEAPSGQVLDPATGHLLDGTIIDHPLGLFATGPIDPERAAALEAAYDAAHGEDVHAIGDLETGDRPYKSVFGTDERVRKTTTERRSFPFSAMLEYVIPLSAAQCTAEGASYPCALGCTASLIDDDHVATGAHCVYSRSDDAYIYGEGGTRGYVCNADDCVDVEWRKKAARYDDTLFADFTHDYAIMRLDAVFPSTAFVMSSLDQGDKSTIKSKRHYNYGYPGAKSPAGLWGMGCDIKYVGDGRLGYKCDTSEGHSGGPVYYRNGSTRYQTAIHVGRAVSYNTGPIMGEIRAWMLSNM